MAEGTYRLEQQRLHDQRTPRLTAEYLLVGTNHDLPAIRLDHHGPVDLDQVEVTLEATAGERQAFRMFDASDGRSWIIPRLRVGDGPDVGIDRPDRFGGAGQAQLSLCRWRRGVDCPRHRRLPAEAGAGDSTSSDPRGPALTVDTGLATPLVTPTLPLATRTRARLHGTS